MKRTSALAWVIVASCLLAWPQEGECLECSQCLLGQGGCFGHSTTGASGCLFGHCRGGGSAGSRSATNYGYGRISRPRSAFVPAAAICGGARTAPGTAPAGTYPPVPVLGGVGGVVTAPPALPVAPYTPPPVATAPIPSVPAPAPVVPYVPPMVVVPQVAPAVPYSPCPCPAPVCVPCTPCESSTPACGLPVETSVPCDPCDGPEFIVPSGGCDSCGPVLAPACDCGPY